MNLYQVVIQLVVIIDRGVTFQEVEGEMNLLFHYILYIPVIHCKIDLVEEDEILEMNQSILYILTIPVGVVDMISNLLHETITTNLEHPCILFIPTAIYKLHNEEVEEKAVVRGVTMMTIILIQHHLLSNHLFTQTTHYCIIRYKGIREEVQRTIILMMVMAVDIGEVGVIIHFNRLILTINMMIIGQFNRILLHYKEVVEDRIDQTQGRATSLHCLMMKTTTMMITWLVEVSPSRHGHELDRYDVVHPMLVLAPLVMILVEVDEEVDQRVVKEIHGVLANQSLIPLQLTVLDEGMIEEGMMTMMHHYSQPPRRTHTAVHLVDHQVWVVVCLNYPKSRLYLSHLNTRDRHHIVHSAYHINVLIERVHMNMIVMIV